MFKKIISHMNRPAPSVKPMQGKRLKVTQDAMSQPSVEIRGTGYPGFFIVFGIMFSLPTLGILAAFTGNMESDSGADWLLPLSLLPFSIVGAGSLFIGLFLWLGRTQIILTRDRVDVNKTLFGKAFQAKSFDRASLDFSFEKSHRSNDTPYYKIVLRDSGSSKIGVGGSLKEAELLWLEQELCAQLGMEIKAWKNITEAMIKDDIEDIQEAAILPNYESRVLTISQTFSGWQAQTKRTVFSGLFGMFFGSVFMFAGAMMHATSRAQVFEWFPKFAELVSDMESSGEPPIFFPFIFGGVGAIVFFSMLIKCIVRKLTLEVGNGQITFNRNYLITSSTLLFSLSELNNFELKASDKVNNQDRYRISIFAKGKRHKLFSFLTKEDAAQLHARLKKIINSAA